MEQTEIATAFTSRERSLIDLSDRIYGWGADLNPANRPGVPMDKAPHVGIETLYPGIEPQLSQVEILKSIEHEQMPPVYGTSCPPGGLSGMMRRFAFTYSEGELTHWLTLLFADRVDVIEDLLKDLSHGKIPNLYKETGMAMEWKYNRKKFVTKIAVASAGVAAIAGAVYLLRKQNSAAHEELA